MPEPVMLEQHDPNANAFIADELNYPLPSAEELATMDSVCSVNHRSPTAHLLIKAKIVAWDEAPMTHRHIFEAVDRTPKDLMKTVDPENEH
ncbi:hypothetical protein BGZ90_009519, partial [Linnemannia elongata]